MTHTEHGDPVQADQGYGSREPYDYSPACWSWPAPTEADWDRIREGIRARYEEASDLLLENGTFMVLHWQRERCAVCGRVDSLVEDHDHETGLFRGFLCRSCNIREGRNPGDGYRVWREYRERNPASICSVQERYWETWNNRFAEPARPPSDPWENNAMRNAGL